MMGKTHLAVGGCAGLAVALVYQTPPATSLAIIAGSVFGALMPDLDATGSTGAHWIVRAAPLAGIAFFLLGPASATIGSRPGVIVSLEERAAQAFLVTVAVVLFPIVMGIFLPHRGPTHSILVWALFLIIAVVWMPPGLPRAITAAVCIGSIIGGILPDAATRSGVPALWPFYKERVHILPAEWRLRTGSLLELLVIRPAVYLLMIYLTAQLVSGIFHHRLPRI
jgi:membrane-bound metal-dependent hydrolase YbcI (DUF457 family)